MSNKEIKIEIEIEQVAVIKELLKEHKRLCILLEENLENILCKQLEIKLKLAEGNK